MALQPRPHSDRGVVRAVLAGSSCRSRAVDLDRFEAARDTRVESARAFAVSYVRTFWRLSGSLHRPARPPTLRRPSWSEAVSEQAARPIRSSGTSIAFRAAISASGSLAPRGGERRGRRKARSSGNRHARPLRHVPSSLIDDLAVSAELARRAGPNVVTELRKLATVRSVQTFRERGRPARVDRLVDLIAENLDRYLLAKRLSLARDLSPERTASPQLLALNRSEAAETALERFVEHNKKDRQLQRFLTLAEQWDTAVLDTMRKGASARVPAPYEAFEGIEDEFEAACVKAGSRSK